jgi:MarR-like DNA-binding transcriptional regulator SgrR of sgrS sRNA
VNRSGIWRFSVSGRWRLDENLHGPDYVLPSSIGTFNGAIIEAGTDSYRPARTKEQQTAI